MPNLAGLARTCEVMRAQQLVLPDLRIVKEPGFTSISVTAEQWVPLAEVPEGALVGWLGARRREGWTLLALEQTAESTPLPSFSFPRRTVLVLGACLRRLPLF